MAKSKLVTYQSRKKRVTVVPDRSAYAVGLLPGRAHGAVDAMMGNLAVVQLLAAQGIALIKPALGIDPLKVEQLLKGLVNEGRIGYYAPVLRDAKTGLMQILNDEITVRFKPGLQPASIRELINRHGATLARQNEFVPQQFVIKLLKPLGLAALKATSQIDAEKAVDFAVPNFISEHKKHL